MKKQILTIVSVVVIICSFVACTNDSSIETASTTAVTDSNGKAHYYEPVTDENNEIVTDKNNDVVTTEITAKSKSTKTQTTSTFAQNKADNVVDYEPVADDTISTTSGTKATNQTTKTTRSTEVESTLDKPITSRKSATTAQPTKTTTKKATIETTIKKSTTKKPTSTTQNNTTTSASTTNTTTKEQIPTTNPNTQKQTQPITDKDGWINKWY